MNEGKKNTNKDTQVTQRSSPLRLDCFTPREGPDLAAVRLHGLVFVQTLQ